MDLQTIQVHTLPILKKYRVTRASLFGSAVRGELTTTSDIDILVELPADVHGFDYIALKVDLLEELKNTLERDVDLVEYKLLKPDLREYILPHQIQIL